MNPSFELAEEEPQEQSQSLIVRPKLTEFERQQRAMEEQVRNMVVVDDVTKRTALLLIATYRRNEVDLNAERKSLTDPLNAQIDHITVPYTNAIAIQKENRVKLEGFVSAYSAREAAAAAERQRKAIEQANAAKLLEDQKAEAARVAAAAARANGNELEAVKLEAKADKAELKAAAIAPEVIQQAPKTTTLFNGTKVTEKITKDFAYTNGLPKGGDYYRSDVRFKDIPDEYWILDEAKIGKITRNGIVVPGTTVFDKSSTVTRKGSC